MLNLKKKIKIHPILLPKYQKMTPLQKDFHEQKYRFLILIIYIMVSGITACLSYTFSSISKSLNQAYSTTEYDIYYVTISYSIYFIPINFIANYSIDHIGVRPSIIFCMLCQVFCSFLRIFIGKSIWFIYIAHTIGAIGNPFCTNSVSKLSVYWFLPENRLIATAIMTASYMLGTSFSFALGGWFVGDHDETDIEGLKDKIQNLLIFTLILSFAIGIITLVAFKERPTFPTSFVSNYPRENYFVALKSMAMNYDFRLLCLGFSLLFGNYVIFITFFDYMIGNFGFKRTEVAIAGSIMNLACVLGKIFIGFIAKKYISLKSTLLLINFAILILIVLFLLSLISRSLGLLYFFSITFGFFLQMYWAPCLELSCEMIFPIGEANANGNLLIIGCIFNMIFGFIFSSLMRDTCEGVQCSYIGFTFFILGFTLSAISFLKMNGKLKREEKEIEMIIAEKYYYKEIS